MYVCVCLCVHMYVCVRVCVRLLVVWSVDPPVGWTGITSLKVTLPCSYRGTCIYLLDRLAIFAISIAEYAHEFAHVCLTQKLN